MAVRCARRWAWLALRLSALALLVAALLVGEEPTRAHRSPRRHLPYHYWLHRDEAPQSYKSTGCVIPPGLTEVKHSSAFWQRVQRGVLIFSAYSDARDVPSVRLLVHSARAQPSAPLRCLFWYYDKGDPVLVNASMPQGGPEELGLVVVSCALPSHLEEGPASVSLVPAAFKCGVPTNILAIQDTSSAPEPLAPGTEPRVAACVSWWRRGDAAARLVDWLQLMKHFRVSKVYLYINHNAHDNVLRVVDYFSREGGGTLGDLELDVMPYASPPLAPAYKQRMGDVGSRKQSEADFAEYEGPKVEHDEEDRRDPPAPAIHRDDLLPYNECVYRARLDRQGWLALTDIDHLILPIGAGSWPALVEHETRAWLAGRTLPPDLLSFHRWWFPALLQGATNKPTNNKPRAKTGGVSPVPTALPPGRAFNFHWRAPNEMTDDAAGAGARGRALLARVGSVLAVTGRSITCLPHGRCHQHLVDNYAARMHLYTGACGGRRRAKCRTLRARAVRDDALRRWARARGDARLALDKLQLRPHEHSYLDDE